MICVVIIWFFYEPLIAQCLNIMGITINRLLEHSVHNNTILPNNSF